MVSVPEKDAGRYSVDVITTVEGFDTMAPVWETIFKASCASLFQSFDWQRTWWEYYGEEHHERRLHILLVSIDGSPVGIAPFFIEHVHGSGLLGYARLAFIGEESSDYLDLIVMPELAEPIALVCARWIAEEAASSDVLILEEMPDRSAASRVMYEALSGFGFRGSRFISEQCPRTQLKPTWEETLASFAINHRREINRRRRNMSKAYTVEFEVCSEPDALLADMDDFIAMHQYRWNAAGKLGVFAHPDAAAFHKKIAARLLEKGMLLLTFLRLNGVRTAASYGFIYGGEVSIYLTGVGDAGDAWKLSPGRVLMGYCMEEAARRGVKVFDFMRGTESYKYEFDGVDVPNWTLVMFAPGSRLAPMKLKVDFLARSLVKRTKQEWFALQRFVGDHGVFSIPTMRYLGGQLRMFLSDGVQKARSPERSVSQSRATNSPNEGATVS